MAISRSAVAHWMSVVAAGGGTAPGVPKFETPQPPSYAHCIAYFEKYPFTSPGQARPSHAALAARCDLQYRREKLKALYTLITYYWVSGEASELGVTLPAQELKHVLATIEREQYPDGEGFAGFLASYRLTRADWVMQLKVELLVPRIQAKLEARPKMQVLTVQSRQQALDRFSREYERKWKGRTNCQATYVVPICRQYKPPKTPPTLVPNSVPLTNLAAK